MSMLVLLSGCAVHRPIHPLVPHPLPVDGPRSTEIDLLRAGPGGPRIYVQATLPDASLGLFLVDTGASITVLSEETAERLDLERQPDGLSVSGLGGAATVDHAVLPWLGLGEMHVPLVDVAVGVQGVPEYAGLMPLDGLIGNNVWSRFVLELDYPADLMVLHRPGTLPIRRSASPMHVARDTLHAHAVVEVATGGDGSDVEPLMVQLDTGASDLLIFGDRGGAFEDAFTEGVEYIRGVGGSPWLPLTAFLRTTRRIPLDWVELGGTRVDTEFSARWAWFDRPARLQPLAGHALFDGHRVIFDFPGRTFDLRPSHRKPRQLDGHDVLLAQDIARHGDAPSRYLFRARLLLWLAGQHSTRAAWEDNLRQATALLEAHLREHGDAEARVILSEVRRQLGDEAGALAAISPMSAAEQVEEGQIVDTINTLCLTGDLDTATRLAEDALAAWPAVPDLDEDATRYAATALVAYSDLTAWRGDISTAREALDHASRLVQNPDGMLMRRVRLALIDGDRLGAMALTRKLLHLDPTRGLTLWVYALLLEDPIEVEAFRVELEYAVARLHPEDRPLDFLVAAHSSTGDHEQARRFLDEGIRRDCDQQPTEATRDNCVAWYLALANERLDEALTRVERALAAEGDRSDFLDTRAVILALRRDWEAATEAARSAARLNPSDPYALWQLERIERLARDDADRG